MQDSDKRHTVNESADKIRVETKVKRGSGTRDQDEIKVKVKGDDAEAVVDKLNDTIERLRATSDTLRDMQPGGEK
jgi:phosphotransferase system HPr-like phosphotransfer protein